MKTGKITVSLRPSPTGATTALGATTVTSALVGLPRTDARSRAEFFALPGVQG
ncbi:MAG TPA: hypothetical protein VK586_12205 [Streptosporangiaceae bacterium]|nr:hypothetical protein [Streptosporangiaceae bacterium]